MLMRRKKSIQTQKNQKSIIMKKKQRRKCFFTRNLKNWRRKNIKNLCRK